MERNFAVCQEMFSSVSISERKDSLVCPKPRRVSPLSYTVNESRAGFDLLDMIFSKGGYDTEHANYTASSPPFFCGSPPSRATNPLVQDAHFGERKAAPSSPLLISSRSSSPSSMSWKGGCASRTNLGHKPAVVRIEGFDCLGKDRRNCSIPAVA
ncbi:hypothetical protein ACHQM5_005696 [Ranunculus cassubicifolius]